MFSVKCRTDILLNLSFWPVIWSQWLLPVGHWPLKSWGHREGSSFFPQSMLYFLSYSLFTEHHLNRAILWRVQLCKHSLLPQLRFCSIFCFLFLFHSLLSWSILLCLKSVSDVSASWSVSSKKHMHQRGKIYVYRRNYYHEHWAWKLPLWKGQLGPLKKKIGFDFTELWSSEKCCLLCVWFPVTSHCVNLTSGALCPHVKPI